MSSSHLARMGIAIARRNKFRPAACFGILLTGGICSAANEAGVAVNEGSTMRGGGVEEIIVTARRRDERLQDVPSAVTAIVGETLERTHVRSLGDIESSVPNLALRVGDAKNAVVYLRGVGQVDSLAFADPGVGIYVDDVYLGRAQGAFLDVFDAARIEVLRGPQGTLYGRNTIGGAVKFVSQAPTPELAVRGELAAGNYQRGDARLMVNAPLGDSGWAARASAAYLSRDGFARNEIDGRDDSDQETIAGRVAITGALGDRLSISWSADGSRADPRTSRTPARMTPVFGVAPNSDPFVIAADFNGRDELEVSGAALTAAWDATDALMIKSITAYRSMAYDTQLDLDATGVAFFGVYVNEDQHQLSQELQASLSSDALQGVFGMYYFNEHDITVSGLYGPAIALVTSSRNDQENRSYAAYGQLTWTVTERLSTTLGLRYTKEKKDFRRWQEFFGASTPFPVPEGQGLLVTQIDTDGDWSSVSPRAGLEFRLSDAVLSYISASRGFKSGGFDGRSNTDAQATPYDPETLWSYEAGLKSTLADGRVTLNTAIFYNDYTDLQLSSFVADSSGGFAALFTNAAAATTQGVEIELVGRLVAGLSLDASVGYLKAEYDEYIGPGGVDISNERELVNAPAWTGRLGASYRTPIAVGELTLDGDLSYRSRYYPTVSSSEVLAQSGFTLANAALSYETPDGRWRISAYGRNLGDKRYIAHGFDLSDSLGYQLAYYGEPRTYGVSLRYQW